MKRFAAILLVLLAPQSCLAGLHDCVCEIVCPPNGGSGTLVATRADGHGLVISVAHVFEGGNRAAIVCEFPAARKKYPARLLAIDESYDLAALDIPAVPDVDMPSAIVPARKEDGPFTCVGFPWNSRHAVRWDRGDYIGYPQGNGTSAFAPSMLHTRTHVISGYSGGARFNRYGEYVGPISGMCGEGGAYMDRTWGASGIVLIRFISRFVELEQ
ncbi:MAG: serine protease [Planctomycetes bacterium]|nr:serine protease [Planctomycetota bacterium]